VRSWRANLTGPTLCETSARDWELSVFAPVPDVVLVNLSICKACLGLLPDMRQLWPHAKVVFVMSLE